MTTLMKASNQWMSRPDDERFTSLPALRDHVALQRNQSREAIVPSKRLEVQPDPEDERQGLVIVGPNGHGYNPTHWSFGQLAQRSGAPAGYLRELPAPLAADCINYGLQFTRQVEDVGVLLTRNGSNQLRAITGPRYGRVWNQEVVDNLIERFGDGVTGDWRVPGEFGVDVEVDKRNTTIYGGDRDMFVFLADEKNRVEVPNRRNGESGSMARGFFVWNSEVGSATLGIGFFLFDYVCMNRIVWGAEQYTETRIRHTVSAPDRWLDEIEPVLVEYSNSSAQTVENTILAAQEKKLDDVDAFLANRWGKRQVAKIKLQHEAEEGRPIESLWDVTVAATAVARNMPHQDTRVEMEREAGDVLRLAA